jgi:hypothetical protein
MSDARWRGLPYGTGPETAFGTATYQHESYDRRLHERLYAPIAVRVSVEVPIYSASQWISPMGYNLTQSQGPLDKI